MPMKFGRRAYNRKYKQRQRVRAKANGLCPSCCCQPAHPTATNQSWAMGFMHDVLADNTKIRLLTIVDIFRRESVALEVYFGFKAPQVSMFFTGSPPNAESRKEYDVITGLNSYRFTSTSGLIGTACSSTSRGPECRQITLSANSFNNRVRQEMLNPTWFRTLEDARRHSVAWRHDYNTSHPHRSLDDLTPEEFARRSKK